MRITHLEARHFRNITHLELELDSGLVVLQGQNGQGKTNILEALYLCSTGKSFRNVSPRDLLQHGQDAGWVRASFQRQGVSHAIDVSVKNGRRTLRVDDKPVRSAASLLRVLNVIAFFPEDLQIIKGTPENRRRFLDRSVANYRADFVDVSLRYQKALKARNALLRHEQSPNPQLIETYNQQLVQYGTVMMSARKETLASLIPQAEQSFDQMLPDAGKLDVELTLGLGTDADVALDYPGQFQQALQKSYPKDRARGTTSVGPHRCDVVFTVGGHLARDFASQGQQRSIVLAMKMAEVRVLQHKLGDSPILLLDDVSSELDRDRTETLFDLIHRLENQIWLTTTGAAALPIQVEDQVFSVSQGQVTSQNQ